MDVGSTGIFGDTGMFGAVTPGGGAYWADVWQDMASLSMSQTIPLMLRWMEYVTYANGTYYKALDRVLSYFITDIELRGIEDDETKEHINDFLHSPDGLDLLDEVKTAGLNYLVYGNDFSTVLTPFKRYLACKRCGLDLPLRIVYNTNDFKFKWNEFEFIADCPKCKYSGPWRHIDRRVTEAGPIKIKHHSPHEMEILYSIYNKERAYIWKIPDLLRQTIRKGHLFHLENTPWEVIQCVKSNSHLRFDKEVIYHMYDEPPAGVRSQGWGLPAGMSNFRQIWRAQLLDKYNEAICLDYIIPFRLVTPAPGPGSGDSARDALLNLNMGSYANRIQGMLNQRRRDPAAWHTLPFPVQYQALGGDATQLAPRDLLDQAYEILLNNVGIPAELYKGSLQLQSAPTALRLFESTWAHLVHNLNGYISFVMKKLNQILSWEKASAKLKSVTLADDANRDVAKLQLMMGGQLSKQTGLGSVGVNFFDETKRQMEEQRFEAEQQNKLQAKLEQAAAMGQMAQTAQQPQGGGASGGAPQAGGGGLPQGSANAIASQPSVPSKPTTPQEMMAKAQQFAQQILQMPESQKDSELINLKKVDPVMHSLVTAQIDQVKQQARNVGGQQIMSQQFGKQGVAKSRSVLSGPFLTLPRGE